jgi:hypothetical protein
VNSFVFSPETVARFTTANSKFRLVSSVSRLAVVGLAAGTLAAGISAWDAVRLYGEKDYDAAAGMGMVAIGTGISIFANTFIVSASPFLGLGPIAWFGIAIAISGGLVYAYCKDSPMDKWLVYGPFAEEPNTEGDYALLQKPQVAFSQFINLIMSLSITTYPLNKIKLGANARAKLESDGVTHGIMLRTNLLQLFNPDKVKVRLFAREARVEHSTHFGKNGLIEQTHIRPISKVNNPIIGSVTSAEGRLYFVSFNSKLPKDTTSNIWSPDSYTYRPYFKVRAQIEIDGQAFPTLSLNQLGAHADATAKPAFNDQDLYWADEVNYPLSKES